MVKKFFATMVAACACALACVLPSTAFAADPSVVYDGGEKAWHGEGLQQQNVLADFSEVLPGDTLVQEFNLEVRNAERAVSVFMRPYADEATFAALADVELLVTNERGNVIAQGAVGDFADQAESAIPIGAFSASGSATFAALADVELLVTNERGNVIAQGAVGDFADQAESAIPIGAFSASGSTRLHIELYAPTTLGNELQGKSYALEWMFIAQEDGEEGAGSGGDGLGNTGQGSLSSATSGDFLSKTNDATAAIAAVLGIVGIVAVAAIVLAIVRLRNRSRH